MKTKPTAADMLHQRGYTFDYEKLAKMYAAIGSDVTETAVDVFEIASVFMIDAYNAGREGKPLSPMAPWLVKE